MIRHSLKMFLKERKRKYPQENLKLSLAEKYLNDQEFHKQLRIGFSIFHEGQFFKHLIVVCQFIANNRFFIPKPIEETS